MSMRTFDNDYALPALPLPALDDTCAQIKRLIRPLVDDAVQAETRQLLDDFAQGEGRRLQALLAQWKGSLPAPASWLRPIWDDMYLSFRGRLPIHMNYAFRFAGERWSAGELPAVVAALAQTVDSLRSGELPPEKTRDGFLSMDTLESMIYSRIPDKRRDLLYYPPRNGGLSASVVCGGHWFLLSLTNESGECLSPAALAKAFVQIRNLAAEARDGPPLGAMSCAGREDAAAIRSVLLQSLPNRIHLESLEKTIFTVCLDEPAERDFVARLIAGAPQNRWHDKSLQLITDGAALGVNIEHSGCDAGIWVYLLGQADRLLREGLPAGAGEAHIQALRWDISEELARLLAPAAGDYRAHADGMLFGKKRAESISKAKIKALQCSPDAFVQILFQAAYYRLTGRFRSTYEASSKRRK